MTKRPNFLFITTDQHRADHLGCGGNPILRTPNIDGIAARGTMWDRFYVANPICVPNRDTRPSAPDTSRVRICPAVR